MKKKVRVNKVGKSLNAVPREDADLEAERGETILTNLSGEGIPEFYEIKGNPHSKGGTPLKVTPGSFIFSKDKKMKIRDPEVLKEFGYKNPKKSGYTPAEISKKFNNSKARETLVDPNADKLSVESAEKLIANYNEKHGLLALIQESQKGFPTGIPKVSTGYLEASGIDIEQLAKSVGGSKNQNGQPQQEMPVAQKGYSVEDKKAFDRLIYDYTNQNNKAGMNFSFNDKDIDLNSGKYNEVMNPIQLKGKKYDRPYFENKRVNQDSTNVIPGVPPEYVQAFWSESGNFIPVGSGGQGYTDKYIKTYKKGNHGSQRYVTNIWDDNANYDELPIREDGGESNGRKRKTKAPQRSTVWDTTKDRFNSDDVMNGDYVVGEDGVVKKVIGLRKKKLDGSDYKDERLGRMQSIYGSLVKFLENDEVTEKLYNESISKIKASKKLSKAEKEKLISLPKEKYLESFLKQQRHVAIIDDKDGLRDKDGNVVSDIKLWDKGAKSNRYKKFAKDNNLEALTDVEGELAQSLYQAFESLKDDPLFADARVTPTGIDDSNYDGNSKISEIDGYLGNTTMGQAVGIIAHNEYDLEDLDYEDVEEEEPQNLSQVAARKETPFWLQDDVNLFGAIGDKFSLRKQTPLELTGNLTIPNPTFYSPDQAIQNVLSSQKTGTEGAKAFGSAADYANFANFTQAKAANQVANEISRVQGQNVGISNQFAGTRAQLMNQDSAIKAASKVREWDKRNLVDANYDNAKRASNAEVRKMFNNRWTNRGITQTMNERDEKSDVDPRTGFTYDNGYVKELDGNSAKTDIHDTALNLMTNYGLEPKDAFDYALKMRGISSPSPSKSSDQSYPPSRQ